MAIVGWFNSWIQISESQLVETTYRELMDSAAIMFIRLTDEAHASYIEKTTGNDLQSEVLTRLACPKECRTHSGGNSFVRPTQFAEC